MGRSAKIRKINFRNCDGQFEDPVVMVADYVFGDSHIDSSVSWLFQKLERYQNDSSFTSNSYTSTRKENDTASSRLNNRQSPARVLASMTFKPLLKADEGSTSSKAKGEESNETSVRSPSTSSSIS